jgi:hypothetical protein
MKMVEIAKSHLFLIPTLVSKMREVPLLKTQVFEINSISLTGRATNPTLPHVQGQANLANIARRLRTANVAIRYTGSSTSLNRFRNLPENLGTRP